MGAVKAVLQANTNFTLVKLRDILNPALDSVTVDLMRKYFRKAREYERTYLKGKKSGKEVETAVKVYKSHLCFY